MTRQAAFRQQRRARGVCAECPNKTEKFWLCVACRLKRNAEHMARYYAAKRRERQAA